MEDKPRTVLLALDGFPLQAFQRSVTPNLWRLAEEGGFSPYGGRSGLPSTTYPAFASLLTGMNQQRTGVRTTAQRPGAVPGWAGGARSLVQTMIHAARDAGLNTAVAMGDQKLLRVLGLHEIERAWPPAGLVPVGTEVDAHGYPTNSAVRPHVLQAAADPEVDLLFVHLNEIDTLGHDLGPGAGATIDCVRAADALVGEIGARSSPIGAGRSWRWSRITT